MYYLLIRIVKITISFKIHFISRNGSSENGWRWNQGLFAISWHWWILQEEGSCLEIIGGWGDWNTFSGFGGLWILHSAWRWNQYYRCCEVTICLHFTMLQKLSKCEVKAWLCQNLMIFLPIRFNVKSNFGEFKRSKNVIFCYFRDWTLIFW